MNFGKLGVAVAMLAASASAFAGDADFTLVNRTGMTIRELYVSPTQRSQWGRDRLGDGMLEQAKSRHFRFGETAVCKQDIKVVFEEDGTDAVWQNVDLCEINKITLNFDRKTRRVSANAE